MQHSSASFLPYDIIEPFLAINRQGGFMPIYDYRCSDCSKTFELLVRVSADPVCPICGSLRLEKLVSCPAPLGRTADIVSRARIRAAREGHFSHYAPSERKGI